MGEQPSDLGGCWPAKGPDSSYSRAAICVHAFGGLQILFIIMIRDSFKKMFLLRLHPIEPCLSPLPSLVHLLGTLIRRPSMIASSWAVWQAKAGGQSLRRYVREGAVLCKPLTQMINKHIA